MHAVWSKTVGAVSVVLLAAGVGWGQPRPDEQWRLGVRITANPGGGVKVVEVFPDSPAANPQVGLKSGSVLLAVDGVLYNDPVAVRNKVLFQTGDAVALIYQDGGQFYEVRAEFDVVTVAATVVPGGRPVPPRRYGTFKNVQKRLVADPRKR